MNSDKAEWKYPE